MVGERGSARMERAPSARGPNSMRPWNQPTALLADQRPRRRLDHLVGRQHREFGSGRGQSGLDLGLREARPEIGAFHGIRIAHRAADGPETGERQRARRPARRRHRPPRVGSRGRQNVRREDFSVGDAVERDAAGHAQVPGAGLLRQTAGHPKHSLVQHGLNRRSHVHVKLGQQLLGPPHRSPEQRGEAIRSSSSGRCSNRSTTCRDGTNRQASGRSDCRE